MQSRLTCRRQFRRAQENCTDDVRQMRSWPLNDRALTQRCSPRLVLREWLPPHFAICREFARQNPPTSCGRLSSRYVTVEVWAGRGRGRGRGRVGAGLRREWVCGQWAWPSAECRYIIDARPSLLQTAPPARDETRRDAPINTQLTTSRDPTPPSDRLWSTTVFARRRTGLPVS